MTRLAEGNTPELLANPAERLDLRRLSKQVTLRGKPDAQAKLDSLAAVILKRELGLEKFAVVHVEVTSQFKVKMQVLQIRVTESFVAPGSLMWELRGRNLRKDGSLGRDYSHHVWFEDGRVSRRLLTGKWLHLERGVTGAADGVGT